MERNHFWLFIGLAVVFALSVEVMKNASSSSVIAGRLQTWKGDDLAPAQGITSSVYKRIKASSPFAKRHERVAGLDPNQEEKPAADGTAATGEAKKDDKKKDVKKTADDKKKDEKKKKKKKKKKKAEGTEDKNSPESEEDEEDTAKKDDADANAVVAQDPGFGGGIIGAENNDNPRTLKEWEEYILASPDFKRTTQLITLYQTGVVEASIFYGVIDSMLEDDRAKMHELAVMALGATPSTRSFSYLAELLNTEQGLTPLKKQVQTYMKTYAQLQYVRILANALSGEETNSRASVEALRLIQASANMYLKNLQVEQPTEQGGAQPTQARTPAAASIVRQFDSILPVLSRVAQNSANTDVREYASQTLSNLTTLLQPHTT